MGCYHPNKAFIRRIPGSSRTEVIIASYNTDHIEIDEQGRVYKSNERYVRDSCKVCVREFREVPCGQCIGCRLDRSRQWATRCALEMEGHEKNCFVTLTYDDEHLPLNPAVLGRKVDPVTGETWLEYSDDEYVNTLKLEDLQNFMKGLRREINKKPDGGYYKKGDENFKTVRYFASGEYGDTTRRSHYHLLLFGYCPSDLVGVSRSDLGYTYYTSETLTNVWKKGFVIVTEASWDTAAYTARYIMKKQTGKNAKFYEENNILPEFCVMSRNPGIGFSWYSDNKKCYVTFLNKVVPSTGKKRTFNRLRYFDKKFEYEYPFDYQNVKTLSEKFENDRIRLKMNHTDKSYLAQLETEEEVMKIKTASLKRKGGEHYKKEGTSFFRQADF